MRWRSNKSLSLPVVEHRSSSPYSVGFIDWSYLASNLCDTAKQSVTWISARGVQLPVICPLQYICVLGWRITLYNSSLKVKMQRKSQLNSLPLYSSGSFPFPGRRSGKHHCSLPYLRYSIVVTFFSTYPENFSNKLAVVGAAGAWIPVWLVSVILFLYSGTCL